MRKSGNYNEISQSGNIQQNILFTLCIQQNILNILFLFKSFVHTLTERFKLLCYELKKFHKAKIGQKRLYVVPQ